MFTKRQSEIIEKSIKLIAEKGIQGFTIRNLASVVGVTESAIYRHFKSKVNILCAILQNFEYELEKIIHELSQSDKKSLEKIDFTYKSHINRFTNNPALVSVLFAEEIFKSEAELAKKTIKILNLNQENFENIIEQGQQKNEIRTDISNDQLALIVLATLRLTVKKWELSKYSFNLELEGSEISKTIKTLLVK